jgi:hypothetical protein
LAFGNTVNEFTHPPCLKGNIGIFNQLFTAFPVKIKYPFNRLDEMASKKTAAMNSQPTKPTNFEHTKSVNLSFCSSHYGKEHKEMSSICADQ